MKYIAYCFMCFLLCSASVHAQNLVPNGSFEDGEPCPTATGAAYYLDHWYLGIQLPDEDWWNWPSPDWWHTCSPSPAFQPPNVLFGYQEPLSGGGMAGVVTFAHHTSNAREVISVELLEELVAGEAYTFSMSAVCAPSKGYGGSSNKLGMKLTTFPYWITLDGAITNWAHYSVEEVLEDTTNWHTFTKEIIADSAYRYLHIGNFFDDSNTAAINYDYVANFVPYYFLDDVSFLKGPLSTLNPADGSQTIWAYPNPASDQVRVESKSGLSSIQVLSLNGQILFEKNLYQTEHFELNSSAWSGGVYILKVIDGEGVIHHLKLIKN